jgi:hypothetical protein
MTAERVVPQLKPEIIVDLDSEGDSPLEAERYLARLKSNTSFHELLDCRHPLGIYNVSTARILKKLVKCCNHLEEYLRAAPSGAQLHGTENRQDQVIDYLELSLYAAAEHVDDLELVGRCFFRDGAAFEKSRDEEIKIRHQTHSRQNFWLHKCDKT